MVSPCDFRSLELVSSFDMGASETHHLELHFEPRGPLPLSGLGCARGRCLAAWWAECLARHPVAWWAGERDGRHTRGGGDALSQGR